MAKTSDDTTTTAAPAALAEPPKKTKYMVSLDLPVIKNAKGAAMQYAPPPFVVDAINALDAQAEYLRCRGLDREENVNWLRSTWGLAEGDSLPFVVEAY